MHCRWLSVRLETLGALAAFSAAVLAIESRGAASQMGLTLSYALQITSLTSMTVRLASVAENAFNAVERIAEYSRLKEEAPAVIEGSAPDDWPSAGKVCYSTVTHVVTHLLCVCNFFVTRLSLICYSSATHLLPILMLTNMWNSQTARGIHSVLGTVCVMMADREA